jgi:hypothetical protein
VLPSKPLGVVVADLDVMVSRAMLGISTYSRCGDLAGDHTQSGGHHRLAGHTSMRILSRMASRIASLT